MKILFLVCCLFLIGCVKEPGNKENVVSRDNEVLKEVVTYGQDVYYFGYVGADFGNTLAAFLKRASDLEVASMAVNPSANGYPQGYFVVFRPKKKC